MIILKITNTPTNEMQIKIIMMPHLTPIALAKVAGKH